MPRCEPPDLTDFQPMAAQLDGTCAEGRTDNAECPYLYARHDQHLSDDGSALIIGTAGVDGIVFALRRTHCGVWAYHPLADTWTHVAPDITQFETLWLAGRIAV